MQCPRSPVHRGDEYTTGVSERNVMHQKRSITFSRLVTALMTPVACLARGLEQRKYRVTREAEFCTEEGVRKPDLIATKMGRSIVIDAQVVNDQTILDLAHKRKAEYYSANTSLRRAIATKCGTEGVQFTSATLSWRGLWSARTAKLS